MEYIHKAFYSGLFVYLGRMHTGDPFRPHSATCYERGLLPGMCTLYILFNITILLLAYYG